MTHYAGIGSRQTPKNILDKMIHIAINLNELGYILRSGGADGADTAFETGANSPNSEIYLPWQGFNDRQSIYYNPTAEAMEIAESFHPSWNRCSQGARKLHARNCHQILGIDLKTPVEFVICWTPKGLGSGGTGQAIRIAHHYNIPVHDIGHPIGIQILNKCVFNNENKIQSGNMFDEIFL